MTLHDRHSAPRPARRPFYRLIWALAASAFFGALATDVAYWLTADFPWVDFSDWLVSAGVVLGVIAGVVGLIERFARRGVAHRPLALVGLDALAWILGFVDMLFHTRDAWTSVVPWGLALSALTVVVLILSEILSRAAAAPAYVEGVA